MIEDDEFFAWLDGELGAEDAARVAQVVAQDPALGAKAERHRAMRSSLQSAFAPLAATPVALPSKVVDLSTRRRIPPPRNWWQQGAALAATLVLGLLVGARFLAPQGSPLSTSDGQLVAAAGLARSLERDLASAPTGGDHRMILTFLDREGRICRSFDGPTSAGIACREGSDWTIETLVGGGADDRKGPYRMASGVDPRLAETIDDMIAGEPFNVDAERAARSRKWTPARQAE